MRVVQGLGDVPTSHLAEEGAMRASSLLLCSQFLSFSEFKNSKENCL